MKSEQEIRDQIAAQRQRIAGLQGEIKAAEGLISGMMYCLNELPGHITETEIEAPLPEWMSGEVAPNFGENEFSLPDVPAG